jgi:hypothetical protein
LNQRSRNDYFIHAVELWLLTLQVNLNDWSRCLILHCNSCLWVATRNRLWWHDHSVFTWTILYHQIGLIASRSSCSQHKRLFWSFNNNNIRVTCGK